jgi:homogentisate 1,2-dioxygenase
MPLNPVYFDKGLAFMFETVHTLKLNPDAIDGPLVQHSYSECWEDLPSLFTGKLEV